MSYPTPAARASGQGHGDLDGGRPGRAGVEGQVLLDDRAGRGPALVVDPVQDRLVGQGERGGPVLVNRPHRPGRRLGILLDHLVDQSKESRLAAGIDHPDVLVTGHPFVDIWAAVKPKVVGIPAWPDVPKGENWKDGVCSRLGVDDPRRFWKQILGSVRSYADLEAPLVGAVEQLIDFVTEPA